MNKRDESILLMAKLVSFLAENGLSRTELASRDFLPEKADQAQIQLFVDTVKWLVDEGVLRDHDCYGDETGGVVFDLVLTSRGFWLLEQKLTADLTLGAAIAETARSKRPATGLAGLGEILGGFAGGAIKSLGSG